MTAKLIIICHYQIMCFVKNTIIAFIQNTSKTSLKSTQHLKSIQSKLKINEISVEVRRYLLLTKYHIQQHVSFSKNIQSK